MPRKIQKCKVKIRFALQGYVTTFKREDLPTLKNLLSQTPETITQAGLHPTVDQIELYAYHLPNSPLSNLMVSLNVETNEINQS